MKKLKVVLVLNIPAGKGGLGMHVPISLLYLGSQLSREGHNVVFFDRRTFPKYSEFLQKLKGVEADLIGIPLFAGDYTLAYELINRIRKFIPSPKIVMGGPEVSANREGVARIFYKADYILSGEAEYTLSQLANCLADCDEKGLESIPGLSYQKEGIIRHNPIPDPIKDIDGIPFPKRDLISSDMWKKYYYFTGLVRPTDVILTSRGCPFSCKFCFQLYPGYRARSSENVLAEIEEIYRRGTRGLNILDDNFIVNRKRCVEILEGILHKGWKLRIKCRGRVDSVDAELLKLMKKAGVNSVTYGIESGSEKLLDAMGKKTSVDQNFEAIKMTKEAGLLCYIDLFLGYPGETRETIKETSDFLIKAKPTGINMGCLFPLRGTEVYEEAKRNGTLIGDWDILDGYPRVKLPWFNDIQELYDEHRKVARCFWLNWGVITQGFSAVIRRFGFRDYVDIINAIYHRYLFVKHET